MLIEDRMVLNKSLVIFDVHRNDGFEDGLAADGVTFRCFAKIRKNSNLPMFDFTVVSKMLCRCEGRGGRSQEALHRAPAAG